MPRRIKEKWGKLSDADLDAVDAQTSVTVSQAGQVNVDCAVSNEVAR
jgi:hypothetical protein